MLRPGVLAGSAIVVAAPEGGGPGELGRAVAARAAELGAAVASLAVDPAGDERAFDGPAAVLVWDGAAALDGGMRAVLDGAWLAIRPVATGAMIGTDGGGRILLLAPRPGAPEAAGARAGLENLARTLSVEWARHGIRTAALLPGPATEPEEVAELAAFLASQAGDYYSGCRFDLGSV
jgi:hypothetical protein